MRILLINQYFYPDMAATAQLLTDLAEDMTKEGWKVTALAGVGSYAAGADQPLLHRENWRGIEIRRVWCTNIGRRSNVGRLADYLTYLCSAALVVLFSKRHDVVLCLSTPPLVAVLGLLGKLRGSRFVYKVEDLYPDIAIALGTLHPGPLNRFLARMSRELVSRADTLVALDESMAGRLAKRGARRIKIISNWADGKTIFPMTNDELRMTNSELVVLYSGNLGLAHRFDAIVAAARILGGKQPNVRFVFVGGGTRLEEVKKGTRGLTNVRFMDYQPREKLNELYNAADVHLVSLRDETAGMQVPCKYSAALAAGRAVLLVGGKGSDLEHEILQQDVGWVCNHEPREIVAAVTQAFENRIQTMRKGIDGRRLFEAKYDRRINTGKWIELINGLVASRRRQVERADSKFEMRESRIDSRPEIRIE